MRTCPTCGARYAPPAQYCQTDGARLNLPSAPVDPYLNARILEQFRVEKIIGVGGMGVVYSALDEGLGRRVAVKILHRDLITNNDIVSRFHREAQIAAQLDHPGIVRVITFGQLPDKNLFLVLEFLEGPTLAEALGRDGYFAPARAVKVMASIAEAIGYAHSRGIVHRDLKPENVILTRRDDDPEHPKVLDFSIAKMLIGATSFVTQSGLIFGTARYISPEGASGDPVDQRGDVYSLGVMAYHLLVGRTPFEAEEPVQLLIKHMHEAPPPMRNFAAGQGVPTALEAVVMRALAKNPAARFTDGAAFARALRESPPEGGIRSLVATTAMPFFTEGKTSLPPSFRDPTPSADGLTQPNGTPSEVGSTTDVPEPIEAQPRQPERASVHLGAGVSVIRRVVRSATPMAVPVLLPAPEAAPEAAPMAAPMAAPEAAPMAAPEAAPSAAAVARLHPRVELPVVAPLPRTQVTTGVSSDPPEALGPPALGPSAPAIRMLAPPVLDDDDFSDIVIAGLPRRRKTLAPPRSQGIAAELAGPDEITVRDAVGRPRSGVRTFLVIAASMVLTLSVVVGVAYALRLFPSQQQADKISGLLRRANDALGLRSFAHSANGEDVEDLTDAVLAEEPQNTRARQLRRAAAMSLKATADRERLGGHPEQAVAHLRDALHLCDDPTIREALRGAEQELTALQHPSPPAAPPRPRVPRPPPRPPPPLVHPPQHTTPLNREPRPVQPLNNGSVLQNPALIPGTIPPPGQGLGPSQEPSPLDPNPGGQTGAF